MVESLLIQFDYHSEERRLIGKIILAYGELEIAVMQLLTTTLRGDTNTAVRTLYRLRSESNRLEVADALVSPQLAQHKLAGAWDEAYAAMKCCKSIRNNYAHGQWLSDRGQLRFGDLDKAALTKGPNCAITMRPLSLAILKKQWAYFQYAHHQLAWIDYRYATLTAQPRVFPGKVPKPKKVPPPKLDSRGEVRFPRLSSQGQKPLPKAPPR